MKRVELDAFISGLAVIYFDKIDETKIKAMELFFGHQLPTMTTIFSDDSKTTYYQYYSFGKNAGFFGQNKLSFAIWILNLSEIFNEKCQPELLHVTPSISEHESAKLTSKADEGTSTKASLKTNLSPELRAGLLKGEIFFHFNVYDPEKVAVLESEFQVEFEKNRSKNTYWTTYRIKDGKAWGSNSLYMPSFKFIRLRDITIIKETYTQVENHPVFVKNNTGHTELTPVTPSEDEGNRAKAASTNNFTHNPEKTSLISEIENALATPEEVTIGTDILKPERYLTEAAKRFHNEILSENLPGFFVTTVEQLNYKREEIGTITPDFEHDRVIVGSSWHDTAFTVTIPMEHLSRIYSQYLNYRKKHKNE